MADPGVDVIVATGGTAVVRAAYRSRQPVARRRARQRAGAGRRHRRRREGGAVPRRLEGVRQLDPVHERVGGDRRGARGRRVRPRAGAQRRARARARRRRSASATRSIPTGGSTSSWPARTPLALAAAAEIKAPPKTRVLVAPFPLIVPEEPLAHEKLFPLLGLVRVPDAARGIDAARALLRIGGAGHSAVIHSTDPRTILAYGAAVGVLRVSVNAPGSTGGSGLDTNLAPTMTVGTGFFGRSSLTENLQPQHLTQWTRLAYAPRRAARRLRRAGAVVGAARAGAGGAAAGAVHPRRPARDDPRRAAGAGGTMAELRSAIFIDQLQPQTMCYLGTWIRGRLPRTGMAAAVIEVAPGLDIEPLTDVAVKHTRAAAGDPRGRAPLRLPRVPRPLDRGRAVGQRRGARGARRLARRGQAAGGARLHARLAARPPARLPHQPQQARARWRCPASRCSCSRCSPRRTRSSRSTRPRRPRDIKVVDYRMIGATGRVYITGEESDVRAASEAATEALELVG